MSQRTPSKPLPSLPGRCPWPPLTRRLQALGDTYVRQVPEPVRDLLELPLLATSLALVVPAIAVVGGAVLLLECLILPLRGLAFFRWCLWGR